MNISKTITSASLALAMIGGLVAFTPASVHAAGKKSIGCPTRIGHRCGEKPVNPPHNGFKKCPKGKACAN